MPYLDIASIIKTCIKLDLPIPDNMKQLEGYSKRYDIQALNIYPNLTYDGEYCMSSLFNVYRMTIKDINLSNWIREV